MVLAHISDLHLGLDARTALAVERLCHTLLEERVEHVLLTGDVTHRGRRSELLLFRQIFAPLLRLGRLVLVPGNHDRLGDDLGRELMPEGRVCAERRGDLFLVRFDSTGPHNRRWLEGHGLLTAQDIEDIDRAFAAAPIDAARVLMLHHHPLPLPVDHPMERLATRLGWPNAAELKLGQSLLQRLRRRCDLVLHGHRHAATEIAPWEDEAGSMRICNAGSSTQLQGCRLFRLRGGRVERDRVWLDAREAFRPALTRAAARALP